jgi:hypothetical protein
MVLFKHQQLGLPNGKKNNASIPQIIRNDKILMKQLAREILATDGVLGFYSASSNSVHKYARIQIRLTAANVISALGKFLNDELGMTVSCRFDIRHADGWHVLPQAILQISRSDDINRWRSEIGFSNPSHISRLMVYEELGHCPPKTGILNRLLFLSGCSRQLDTPAPIPRGDMISMIDLMKKNFDSPILSGKETLDRLRKINFKLQSRLHRGLPEIATY